MNTNTDNTACNAASGNNTNNASGMNNAIEHSISNNFVTSTGDIAVTNSANITSHITTSGHVSDNSKEEAPHAPIFDVVDNSTDGVQDSISHSASETINDGAGGVILNDTPSRNSPNTAAEENMDNSKSNTGSISEACIERADTLSDETMFSLPRMAQYLKTGSDSQKLVLIFELQQMLNNCPEETMEVLLPVVCEEIHNWNQELQISAAEALLDLRNHSLFPDTAQMVYSAAFRVLEYSSSGDLFESWGEILVIVLPSAKGMSQRQVIDLVQTIDGFVHSAEDIRRKLAARILGSVSACLKRDHVEEYILPRAIFLTADRDVEARGMAAESLSSVGSQVSLEITESDVWPILVSLLHDEDARIHAATLRAMSHILETFREEHETSRLFHTLLPPVFAQESMFARRAANKDQRAVDDETYLLLEIISEVFGSFLVSVHSCFATEADQKDAYKAFSAMATCNGPIVRRHCAFNMPAVATCLAGRYSNELAGVVEYLSRDPDAQTRWILAAGMSETVAVLRRKTVHDNLLKATASLLKDENPLVRINILEHFDKLLGTIVERSGHRSAGKMAAIFQNLALLAEGNWRTQELLAKQLEHASALIPADNLRTHILPLLISMAEESTFRVRKAVMPAIAKAMSCIPSQKEREGVMQSFCIEWGNGSVYWMRTAFLDCAKAARNLVNEEAFKKLFLPTVLRLVHDNVVNVRLRVAQMFHELAAVCHNGSEYQELVQILKEDSDRDIREVMKGIDDRIAAEFGEFLDISIQVVGPIDDRGTLAAQQEQREAELEKSGSTAREPAVQKRRTLPLLRLRTRDGTPSQHEAPGEEACSPISAASSPRTPKSPKRTIAGLLASPRARPRENTEAADQGSFSPVSLGRKALRLLFGQNMFGMKRRPTEDQQQDGM